MKKTFRAAVIIVLVAAAGWYVWSRTAGTAEGRYIYRTQKVTTGSITTAVSATGKLSAVEMVDVGTQVSGKVKELLVDFNSEVKQGMLLAVLDPDVLTSQVEAAKASLTVAQAGVETAAANQSYAAKDYARNKELWDRKLIARSNLDAAEKALVVANANLSESRARVIQAKEQLRQAQTNLSYAAITSPIDGVVVNKAVEVGQTVAASFNTPTLFSIARDLTQMQIQANIDEADIGSIKPGQTAEVTFDTWPNDRFTATVSQIRLTPTTVSSVVTYTVILKIDNPDQRLLPGMTANLNVITERRDGVLRIPTAAQRFSPPQDVAASMSGAQDANTAAPKPQPQRSGLIAAPPRRPAASKSGSAGQSVWVVENGKLAREVVLDEIGPSDRTWVEVRGNAASMLPEGTELAVSFVKESEAR